MSTRRKPLCIAAALFALSVSATGAQAAGQVELRWVQPEQFSDIGGRPWSRESTLEILGDYIRQFARRLPDGQTLQVEVTDVDLAGEVHHRSWHETRLLLGRADVPRIALRYDLQADGRSLKAGEARLSDLDYLGSPQISNSNLRQSDLGHEKLMLERWFRDTIAPAP